MRLDEVLHVVNLLGVRVSKVYGDKIIAFCPFGHLHSKGYETSPSFAVLVPSSGRPGYNCLACGSSGNLLKLPTAMCADPEVAFRARSLILRAQVFDAPRESKPDYSPFGKPKSRRVEEQAERPPAFQLAEQLSIVPKPKFVFTDEYLTQRYKDRTPSYMLKRGFDEETCRTFQIMDDPRLRRAVFPMRDWSGGLLGASRRIYWTKDFCPACERSLVGVKGECVCGFPLSKYLHFKGMNRNSMLYGEWLDADTATPVLVEGFTDVMRLWQGGVRPPWFVPMAIMGASLVPSQLDRLFVRLRTTGRGWVRPILIRDADVAGEAMIEDARAYAQSRSVAFETASLPDGYKDVGEMPPDLVAAMLVPALQEKVRAVAPQEVLDRLTND